MATFNKFQVFVQDVHHKVHNLSADVMKVMLTNTAPVVTNTVLANLVEITAQFGYAAGGTAPAITSSGHTAGVYKLVLADVVFTASGGQIGPFRYAVLYNSTPAAGPLICWHDYGSSITLNDTETFTWDASAATGILTTT